MNPWSVPCRVTSNSTFNADSPLSHFPETVFMQSPVDQRLVIEAEQFSLRFACPDCVHFEPASETCSNGFPNEWHRNKHLELLSVAVFCKSFELT